MFKEFFIRKMLASKMKGVPREEQDKIIKLVTENPELFQKIGTEIQEKIKEGKDQMAAAMEVMRSHKDEIEKIMGNK